MKYQLKNLNVAGAILGIFFFSFPTFLTAQFEVKGIVLAGPDCSEALIGVNIIEKGTSRGTVTDFNGNFSIFTSPNATLIFSFSGLPSQEVVVGNQSNIRICLGREDCDRRVDFEDLALNQEFGLGQTFGSRNTIFEVVPFLWSGNRLSTGTGTARISGRGFSGGSGKDLTLGNISIKVRVPEKTSKIILNVGHFGGNMNLRVNGDFLNFSSISTLQNRTLGGVNIQATGRKDIPGVWTFTGNIHSLELGGQEFFIDNLCFQTNGNLTPFFVPDFNFSDCKGLLVNGFQDQSINAREGNNFQYEFFIDNTRVYPNESFNSFEALTLNLSSFGVYKGTLIITSSTGIRMQTSKLIMALPEINPPSITLEGDSCDAELISAFYFIPPNSSIPEEIDYLASWSWINLDNPEINGRPIRRFHNVRDNDPINFRFSPRETGRYRLSLDIGYENGNCRKLYDTIITYSTQVNASISKSYQICSGVLTANATVLASNGIPPYRYALNNSSFQEINTFKGLNEGRYNYIVQDDKGCATQGVFQISPEGEDVPALKIDNFCAHYGSCPSDNSLPLPVEITFTASNSTQDNPNGRYRYFIKRLTNGQIVNIGTAKWNEEFAVQVPAVYGGDNVDIAVVADLTGSVDVINCPIHFTSEIPKPTLQFNMQGTLPVVIPDGNAQGNINFSIELLDKNSNCFTPQVSRVVLYLEKKQNSSFREVSRLENVLLESNQVFSFSGAGQYRIKAIYAPGSYNCVSFFDFEVTQ